MITQANNGVKGKSLTGAGSAASLCMVRRCWGPPVPREELVQTQSSQAGVKYSKDFGSAIVTKAAAELPSKQKMPLA